MRNRYMNGPWIIAAMFLLTMYAGAKSHKTKYWHYDPGAFHAQSETIGEAVSIEDVALKKMVWNNEEKRIALYIKTPQKLYKDLYLFCQKKPKHYYCPVEDDGGYVKVDDRMNLQLDVEFAKETDEGMVSELEVVQKEKNRWIKPHNMGLSTVQSQCSTIDPDKDKIMFFNVKRRYPELTMQEIKGLKLRRYYDRKEGINIVAPMQWKDITKEGDAILYLLGGKDEETRKFMLRTLSRFWKKSEENNPRRIITKAAKLMEELSTEAAQKDGDRIKAVGRVKIYKKPNGLMGHFILRRRGKTNRWESYTLIWAGKKLYLLGIMSPKKELLMGEFLSALGAESFCSRGE